MLAKLGEETVVGMIGAWKKAGEPTDMEIWALFIEDKPEDLLKTWKKGDGGLYSSTFPPKLVSTPNILLVKNTISDYS